MASKVNKEVARIKKNFTAYFEQRRQKWKETDTPSENSAHGSNSKHEFSEANSHESSETDNNLERLKTPQTVQPSRTQFKYPPNFDYTKPSRSQFKIVRIARRLASELKNSRFCEMCRARKKKKKQRLPDVALIEKEIIPNKRHLRQWERNLIDHKAYNVFLRFVVDWRVKVIVDAVMKFLVKKIPFLERFQNNNPGMSVLIRELPEIRYFL